MRRRLAWLLAVVATAAALTALVTLEPSLRFAYRAPALHVALETAASLAASLAALLVLGRLRRTGSLREVLTAAGFGVLAISNLGFSALPSAALAQALAPFATWAPLGGSVAGSALLAAAAFTPAAAVVRPRAAQARALAIVAAVVALVAALTALLDEHLRTGVPPSLSPAASARPLLLGSPVLLAGQGLAASLFAAAAVGFVLRARGGPRDLELWIGFGCVLGAFGRLHYLLFPAVYADWIHTGDLFRLGLYLLLVVGAVTEIAGYWRTAAAAAVLEERRRVARDLHDGLAQELAYLTAEAPPAYAAVAQRALDEARGAIAALTRPLDEPLRAALAQAAEEVAQRFSIRVELDLEHVEASADAREALVRIVREAMANAGRHGGARSARVALRRNGTLRLTVEDDGEGFDPGVPTPGLGLVFIRERTHALGGELALSSACGSGTRLEVTLP